MRLSFIIPCYNAEKYIRRCLDSILSAKLTNNEYEIVCFDDCSLDETPQILDGYNDTLCNLRIIHSQENIGPGGGRNRGLEVANGRYVWFVDADDIIDSDPLEKLLEKAENNNLDVLALGYRTIAEDQSPIKKFQLVDSEINEGAIIANSIFPGGLTRNMGFPWRFIIKRDYLLTNHIFFPEKLVYGEDTVWAAKVVLFANRFQSSSNCPYMYWQHSSSTSGQLNVQHKGIRIYEFGVILSLQLLYFVNELIKNDNCSFSPYADEIMNICKKRHINFIPIMLGRSDFSERSSFYKQMKDNEIERIYEHANLITKCMLRKKIGRANAEIFTFFYKFTHLFRYNK